MDKGSGMVLSGNQKDHFDENGFCTQCDDGDDVELSADMRRQIQQGVDDERFDVQKSWLDVVRASRLDLLEVCAPWDSPLAKAVREQGGTAMAIGVHNGFDLSTREGFLKAAALVRETKPRYIHFSPPCCPWSSLQNANQRNEKQVHGSRPPQ